MSERTACPACFTVPNKHHSVAIIAPWVRELTGCNKRVTKYYCCNNCKSGWAGINYSSKELQNLYDDYRGSNYVAVRRKWEASYSSEFNSSINQGDIHMDLRRTQMHSLLTRNSPEFASEAVAVLDIGGGHGSLIPKWPKLKYKFVLDISGVDTEPGITRISQWSEVRDGQLLSLVMACGILEHLTSPKEFIDEINLQIRNRRLMNSESFFYFEVPGGVPLRKKFYIKFALATVMSLSPKLWRFYDRISIKNSGRFPLRIAEHLQFFSPEGLKVLVSASNLQFVDAIEYRAKESLVDSKSVRFADIIGAIAKIQN